MSDTSLDTSSLQWRDTVQSYIDNARQGRRTERPQFDVAMYQRATRQSLEEQPVEMKLKWMTTSKCAQAIRTTWPNYTNCVLRAEHVEAYWTTLCLECEVRTNDSGETVVLCALDVVRVIDVSG